MPMSVPNTFEATGIYILMYIYRYTYIYTYIERESDTGVGDGRGMDPLSASLAFVFLLVFPLRFDLSSEGVLRLGGMHLGEAT